ncbi:MAG TPA: NAD(P)-dependent oxidoreductase [Burkholderiales bacterium]|nr:NAD(P)-dependent oxidoreductase [Burkholderiales bacterium]
MKILLTGAAGFLGRACTTVLRNAGHDVVTTDRHGAVHIQGDLAEAEFTRKLPPVEVVVHAAAVQYVSGDLPLWNRRLFFARNNVTAARLLAERYSGKAVHFVNVGTSMMYRQCGAPSYSPSSPMQGQGVYSESKLAAQRSVAALLDDWATVVPCIIGGPGREGLFRGFVRSIQRGGLVAFPGQGNVPTHMVHVEDTAALIERVVRVRATGLFNAGAPSPLSISQWIGEIASELGVRSIRILRVPLAPIHLLSALTGYRLLAREQLLMLAQPHVLDVSRSLKLGWAPTRTNAQIIRETARHIADSPD